MKLLGRLRHRQGRASSWFGFARIQISDSRAWEIEPHERIMVIAPHPDDEVLAAGGVIANAVQCGNPLRVIVATNGDASYATALAYGSHLLTRKNFQQQAVMRQRESLNALASLGVSETQVHFWGFPDRGLAALWDGLQNNKPTYRSFTTGFQLSTQALNMMVLPYTAESLNELFKIELLEFCPTRIIMPHPHDNHSDHSALAGFTLRAVKNYADQTQLPTPMLLAYWMWHKHKPWRTGIGPRNVASFYHQTDSALVPNLQLTLSPAIQEQKLRALHCYPSQKIPAGKIFRSVSRSAAENFTILQPIL
ncbi:MAG TPA: PIG-L family deacetylase [Anaerolineales bacterium]|nr:PIG-L family deacetylase [Anaerolineales bacterium]